MQRRSRTLAFLAGLLLTAGQALPVVAYCGCEPHSEAPCCEAVRPPCCAEPSSPETAVCGPIFTQPPCPKQTTDHLAPAVVPAPVPTPAPTQVATVVAGMNLSVPTATPSPASTLEAPPPEAPPPYLRHAALLI